MKSPCLKYFNVNKAVTVSVDASKNGLGAVLLQECQPVDYGSVSLTQTQQRYAQIEKELMAVIHGEREHLLMIDYLSKYVELKPLNSTTAQSVITVMKSIYATHGIPRRTCGDGGPPYNSNLMMNFFREWGII
ncbi:retrovirus-related Pol polyprotein from transposon 17.6 [Trichonephila inaurata madagascariensis]|uniref:Retrovirus-related Pol polyprotein from transposon 17.6 n=1 Tax=Trichonephila inaurata madagascariensis TaxID=2747483 RepID=A0A8X6I797_9ARAC|nr:retrovirus-related Pol polyprotein from transposon 17.6 [Trichonephila inaurata madagascariensis]